jgi:hypothetical protein
MASADEPETVIHLAQHPSGYYVRVPELPAPELVPEVENSVSGSSILPTTSWVESSVMASTTGTGTAMLARPKKLQAEHSLHKVMQTCPNWRKALAYLRVLLRIALCCGHSDNPHVLVNVDYAERRLELIRSC